ncbi:hypothetical protein D6C98_10780 [Aureobasidium pullulans]|nr:hypothetical protein D6C98_10780 [Aureobasidium pullulans]
MAVHEAPVYVPGINKLFVGVLEQGFESDGPVYAPNGGTYHGGLVHWGAGGGNNSIGGTEQRPGIRVLDPTTNKTTTLLNNYFGFYFNGLDNPLRRLPQRHLVRRPRLRMEWQPDRHNPSTPRPNLPFSVLPTGQLWVVEDFTRSTQWHRHLPLMPKTFTFAILSLVLVALFLRIILTFTLCLIIRLPNRRFTNTISLMRIQRLHLFNKRPFYYSQEWVPDGVNVAANGSVVAGVGVGMGVDVIDRTGSLVLQIRTHYIVKNFALGGRGSYGILVGWGRVVFLGSDGTLKVAGVEVEHFVGMGLGVMCVRQKCMIGIYTGLALSKSTST